MDPLQALLKPLTVLMNRQIALTTPARELCADLDGKTVAVRVRQTALAAYFRIHEDSIDLTGSYEGEPDVVVSGSLMALGRLATPDASDAIREGSVELHGDAHVAQSFQKLLRYSRPDLEEEISGIIGDPAAQMLGDLGRRMRQWGRNAGETMRQNVGEYLQEEADILVSREEVRRFQRDVSVLRDDVARIEARLNRFEQQHKGTAS